ncbi:imidazolonepropionase [bacterium]|nr:imidazolonepropionase [bacterium]
MKADLLIENAAQLATPLTSSEFGPAPFVTIEDGAVAVLDGVIVKVGTSRELRREIDLENSARVVDAGGSTVTPGLVDCHTHPVFNGTREHEFEMRLAGKSYEDIACAGGGIRSSVRDLRRASKEELVRLVLFRVNTFLSHGTTTVEAKSGYGLSLEDELKSLEVIAEVDRMTELELVPTFLGAHEVPDEFQNDKEGYLNLVIREMMPTVKERGLAEFCDVFCESHVFSRAESHRVLRAAKDAGFGLKIHADQLTRNGGCSLAAELGATSADHGEYSNLDDWEAMLAKEVVPVLLPGAVFFLRSGKYAPAQEMQVIGLPLALATDFNPGTCMSESMSMMLTLGCLQLGLTPAQALTGATYHAALALRRGNLLGTLEVGKRADIVIWGVPNYKHLSYHFGINHAKTVIKDGKIVWENRPKDLND